LKDDELDIRGSRPTSATTPKVGWSNGAGQKTSFEVRTIYELLDIVRKKPGLFIGEPSLTALRGFIDGFRYALSSVSNPFEVEDPPFTKGFDDWIAARFGFRESTSGWKNMLLSSLDAEAAAFERFFIELDEYRRDKGR
jgi:hypothetical protein